VDQYGAEALEACPVLYGSARRGAVTDRATRSAMTSTRTKAASAKRL